MRRGLFQPWRVYKEFVIDQDPRVSNPLKLILVLASIFVLLAFITPTSDFFSAMYTEQMAENRSQIDTEAADYKAGHKIGVFFGEVLKGPFLTISDEYPFLLIMFFVPMLALGMKWASPGKNRFSDMMILAGYIYVSISVIFTPLQYIALWILGPGLAFAGVMNWIGLIQLLAYGYFSYSVLRNIHGLKTFNSLIRACLSVVLMHLNLIVSVMLILFGVGFYGVQTGQISFG
ncbi:MAG: hypothetical protein JKY60_17280 [Kordiimonadaceae bacterium]|nr:hypothetical protein [Kordiimonadaceae bacterium]